ncbi:DUF3267 domain-containing protein (plasmid) [Aneurinibacillus sp. Ricciae_BoGa-3]|uniref:DUF3267 domain-containing protein n=1 Tax=Aneurinibacillus sp. Ricciae_BoGa-3 TaxID=3022697 RepID=UPI00233FE051|nr:DUF3267 domain-containing protein [Aneurinibacillus sp. Ricciae_BoGa-3]WCK57218.1 DUF3267 domain-containing protein [Aneurinibacillus sp. Ricciae_BoGa-3]
MTKIDEIKQTENPIVGGLLTLLVSAIIGYLVFLVHPFPIATYMNPSHIVEILLIPIAVVIVFFFHEMIHIGFFYAIGKGKTQLDVKWIRGAVFIHQMNPDLYFTKRQMLIILLSPVILLTVLMSLLMTFSYVPFLLYANILFNLLESSIDIYVSYRLLRHKSPIFVNFETENVNMNIYKP